LAAELPSQASTDTDLPIDGDLRAHPMAISPSSSAAEVMAPSQIHRMLARGTTAKKLVAISRNRQLVGADDQVVFEDHRRAK